MDCFGKTSKEVYRQKKGVLEVYLLFSFNNPHKVYQMGVRGEFLGVREVYP